MSTGLQTSEIVLPGYTLAERIGSGGYAEVWRAEAPGGIQKAVKIVYGYYDDEFASQELKALERIKGVRHPFLLSLERFEIINGRLAILTELADMSLDQRLRECRAKGLTGIPRPELLQYIADTAEALDFLSQRHSLLHLDIKPENLLVLGEHIKVADFGLVKELASRTQNSLVSGMTPTYASPEMFDDEPSAQSDQYSLAIVYQEMLVATLPFPGRTAAQLAKQHTQAEPQLLALPVEDRPIVARALAKNPLDRYPSCKAFVDALLQRAKDVAAHLPIHVPLPTPTAPPAPAEPAPDDTKPSSLNATIRRGVELPVKPREVTRTQPVVRGERATEEPLPAAPAAVPEPFVPEEFNEVTVPDEQAELACVQPTLYVAIGGVGTQVLCRLRAMTAADGEIICCNDTTAALALDTDRDELREACSGRWQSPLASEDTLHLPLRLPKSYGNAREILGWVSRRWLYNIPRSLETRGYRPLGRVALVDHAQQVLAALDHKLERLAESAQQDCDSTVRVVLLAGMGGGTGAGMLIDVANAIRSVARQRGMLVEVQAFLVCTCFGNAHASPLVAANTYSLLTELNHVTERGNVGAGEQTGKVKAFVSSERPFDRVYCVSERTRTAEGSTEDILETVAKYLALDTKAAARGALRSCRATRTAREEVHGGTLTLQKFGLASLADRKCELLREFAADLAAAVEHHWITKDTSTDWPARVQEEQRTASAPKLKTPASDGTAAPPAVVPVNDATPLALRGHFGEHMSLKFASEVLAQIQRQLVAHDDCGRPRLTPLDAKQLVDRARSVANTLTVQLQQRVGSESRFAGAPIWSGLIAESSRRILAGAVDKFDYKQPDRFLPVEGSDALLPAECLTLVEEYITDPTYREAINSLMPFDDALALTLERANTDLLQCGADRRTLVFVPEAQPNKAAMEKLLVDRPLAAIRPADVDDVVIVTEDSGISPRSLALGLERVFPGIADAARRLLTRIDIEWQALV